MPTQQEMMIAKLIGDMKQAVKRKADESDSEDSIQQITNRGNKLRKKARYVHEGQLGLPNGPQVYKKTIIYNEHYQRDIISERPRLVDEDGYDMDSEDDDDGEALAAANEFYPYNDVRIEELLAPLTSVTELPNHPTLSRPFTSKTLTELSNHARMMMFKEKQTLWRMKHMLTKLSGDHIWIPTAMLETPNDLSFFGDGKSEYRTHMLAKDREDVAAEEPLSAIAATGEDTAMHEVTATEDKPTVPLPAPSDPAITEDDVAMVDVPKQGGDPDDSLASTIAPAAVNGDGGTQEDAKNNSSESSKADTKPTTESPLQAISGAVDDATTTPKLNAERPLQEETDQVDDPDTTLVDPDAPTDEGAEVKEETNVPPPRRMRTRAQAQAASDDTTRSRTRSLSSASNSSFVHPYFLAPESAVPDGDFSLPAQEAEETRRLLQLYIQKQEEITRGSQRLYEGLLTADRQRQKVMRWAKAEAHTGENAPSDGEDWYDEEDWNLDGPLKKGQDEEEEDAATTAKKTRTRRQ